MASRGWAGHREHAWTILDRSGAHWRPPALSVYSNKTRAVLLCHHVSCLHSVQCTHAFRNTFHIIFLCRCALYVMHRSGSITANTTYTALLQSEQGCRASEGCGCGHTLWSGATRGATSATSGATSTARPATCVVAHAVISSRLLCFACSSCWEELLQWKYRALQAVAANVWTT